MKLGRRAVVTFGAQVGATIIGFLATIYFARVLGEDVLGSYFLVVAIVLWVKALGTVSVETAVEKRISSDEDPRAHFGAGAVVVVAVAVGTTVLFGLFREQVRSYVDVPVEAIVAIICGTLVFSYLGSILQSEQRVHVASLLEMLDRLVRSLAQIALVVVGFGTVGLLAGHIVGVVVAAVVAATLVTTRLGRPRWRHFTSLFEFAKYSWLSGIKSRTFTSMDTLVLGVFVSTGLIGIYEIAWNVASVLVIFSNSIVRVLFPTISAAEENTERVAELLEDATAFTGLFVIPGLVGSVLLGREVLAVYGTSFEQGATVLVVLVSARLLQSYTEQFTTALMAVDRPEISFRINAVFVVVNLSLNLVLVWTYGWIGAAVATLCSSGLALALSFRAMRAQIAFAVPIQEIRNQWLAALAMGIVVVGVQQLVDHTLTTTLALVALGATVYVCCLALLSPRFRKTVARNL